MLRLQQVGAVGKVVPHGEQQVAIDAALELHVVVAAPGQRAQQAEAVFLLRAVGSQAQQETGGAFLGGFNAGGRGDADGVAGGNGLLLHVVLSRPRATESGEVVVRRLQGDGSTGSAEHL